MKSGLFNRDAINKECPEGYLKICEGTTAVLLSPPMLADNTKNSAGMVLKGDEEDSTKTQHVCYDDAKNKNDNNTQRDNEDQSVFYNPAQVVNRDLSVCVIETFSQMRLREPRKRGGMTAGLTILEALSATGLRAIRYYKEISNIRYIIANDLDSGAVECITRNCTYNDVPIAQPSFDENFPSSLITLSVTNKEEGGDLGHVAGEIASGGGIIPNLDDAIDLMHRLALNPGVHSGKRFCLIEKAPVVIGDARKAPLGQWSTPRPVLQQELMDVVDLDPYGTASPFLNAAFACIKDGGLMLVTSTDSAVLCGNYPGTCHAKYDSIPYKSSHCHEMAVRILLACMERAANKHKKYIVPLLSLHIDFYVRCFVRVFTQPAEVKLSASKLGYQLQCTNCPAFWVRPIAVARAPRASRRTKKRPREAAEARRPLSGTQNEEARRTAPTDESLFEATAGATPVEDSDVVPPALELYPPAPSRQNDPKLTSLTLQMLPRFSHTDANPRGVESGQAGGPIGTNPGAIPAPGATADDFCPVCGAAISLSGPIYAAPTQNVDFIASLMETVRARAAAGAITAAARITGLVQVALAELPGSPLFYRLPDLASYVRGRCPPTPVFVAALARLGYHCSQVHCEPSGLKTDCPAPVLFAVMLRWRALSDEDTPAPDARSERRDAKARQSGSSSLGEGKLNRILVSPLMNVNFGYDRQYDFRRQVTGVAKFIPNAPGWGPKRRHQGPGTTNNEEV